VSEYCWRDAITQDEHFAVSETPFCVARALRPLACDPNIMSKTGQALATWNFALTFHPQFDKSVCAPIGLRAIQICEAIFFKQLINAPEMKHFYCS